MPTWRLAAAAAVAAAIVVIVPVPPGVALAVVDAALVVVALVDWRLAPDPRRLDVVREVPDVVGLGAEVALTWRVANPSDRAVTVRLADGLAPSLGAVRRRATLRVPPRGRAAAATTLQPRRRGRFEPTAVTLRVDGPLRLAARQATVAIPGLIRVYPAFPSRRDAELRGARARLLEAGLRSTAGRGGGTAFDSLRDYTVDDEFRRIDWAATARARRPIVRVYREERNQTVIALVDSGRTMAGVVAGVPRLDHAMDAVLALTTVGTRLGDRVGLVAFADAVRGIVAPGSRGGQLARVTEALYRLEPRLVESDVRAAFAETLTRYRRRALLVVLTELSEHAVAATLLPALPLVGRDHLVVVAAVRDPELDRWAGAVPVDAAAAYRKAAAARALADRRRTVAALRGRGVVVVDEVPGRLAPRLADAYLTAKATGRL